MSGLDYMQVAVDLYLKDYGVHASEHRVQSCGAHTGHTVQDMALAISPQVADFIVRACNSHYPLFEALSDIVRFCDDPRGSEQQESLALGLARLLPAARVALAALAATPPAQKED